MIIFMTTFSLLLILCSDYIHVSFHVYDFIFLHFTFVSIDLDWTNQQKRYYFPILTEKRVLQINMHQLSGRLEELEEISMNIAWHNI